MSGGWSLTVASSQKAKCTDEQCLEERSLCGEQTPENFNLYCRQGVNVDKSFPNCEQWFQQVFVLDAISQGLYGRICESVRVLAFLEGRNPIPHL